MVYDIVVVDDEPVCLEQIKGMLSSEDMKVACLRSGEQLLRYVEKYTPDLILMDILMPGMDGFDTYIELRKFEDHAGRQHTPVIYLSAEDNEEAEEMGLIFGASDFIVKPANKDVLVRRIDNAIRSKKKIADLIEEATQDKLTGFFNKAKGTERVAKLCSRKTGTLAILDLDSFKLVNDLFGHETGDEVLKAFSNVLRKNTRETDTICRIGGDEFMVFYEDLTDERVLNTMCVKLNKQLCLEADRIMGVDNGIPLGISIGAVMIPEQGREYEALFAMADSALYKVKQNGKHGYTIYHEEDMNAQHEENSLDKLERIEKILEERNSKDGAYILGKEAFTVAYRLVVRLYRRYGGCAALLLFDLEAEEENKGLLFTEAVTVFGSILEKKLRMSDIVMQNSSHSFFIMLTECEEPDIENALVRVTKAYNETKYKDAIKLQYIFKYMKKIPPKYGNANS